MTRRRDPTAATHTRHDAWTLYALEHSQLNRLDLLPALQRPCSPRTRVRAARPQSPMQLYRLLLALIAFFALFAVTAAEDTGSDPCLAEDYAEQNCARTCRARARASERALALTRASPSPQTARAAPKAATSSRATSETRLFACTRPRRARLSRRAPHAPRPHCRTVTSARSSARRSSARRSCRRAASAREGRRALVYGRRVRRALDGEQRAESSVGAKYGGRVAAPPAGTRVRVGGDSHASARTYTCGENTVTGE